MKTRTNYDYFFGSEDRVANVLIKGILHYELLAHISIWADKHPEVTTLKDDKTILQLFLKDEH